MRWLLTVFGIWGIGDSLWLATHRTAWVAFWSRWIADIGRRPPLALTLALVDLVLSASLIWSALSRPKVDVAETPPRVNRGGLRREMGRGAR